MIKIDKGIPLPTDRSAWPFSEMEVGDSFAVKIGVELEKVRSASFHWGKKNNKKFAVKQVDKNGNYRCWRIA